MLTKIRKISIIGAGCVGSFFAREFFKLGFEINQIIARRKFTAISLANEVNADAVSDDFNKFDPGSDLYIMSVKDEVIMELRNKFPVENKIIVHTSGSVPMNVFKKASDNYGVLYPLQTIVKFREIDISTIPFFINASNEETFNVLEEFTKSFADHVVRLDDHKRMKLHMAAVFASNFTNYLYKIAEEILNKEGMELKYLQPLVKESMERAFEIGPDESQTGPAKRGDCSITDKHKALLDNDNWRQLYTLFSDMIREEYKNKGK